MEKIRERNGYFTVEATVVLPLVMGMILFLVYMMFFQYDRCLQEQDMHLLYIWGSALQEEDENVFREVMEEKVEELYRGKYVAWEASKLKVSLNNNILIAESEGGVTFPFPGLNFWNKENIWDVEAVSSGKKLPPKRFIRMCNKLLGD